MADGARLATYSCGGSPGINPVPFESSDEEPVAERTNTGVARFGKGANVRRELVRRALGRRLPGYLADDNLHKRGYAVGAQTWRNRRRAP